MNFGRIYVCVCKREECNACTRPDTIRYVFPQTAYVRYLFRQELGD